MSHWFAIVCTLTLLPVLLACAPSAAAEEFTPPSNMEELSQWVTTAFPEWDEERVTGFVGELSLALDETSRPLSPAERSDLIAHTPARVMHSLLSRVELVPSSIPSFVETYRYDLENYVNREPPPPEETERLTEQLGDLIRYGRESWDKLGTAGDLQAESELEAAIERLWWRLESTFSETFKRAFSDAEMEALYDTIDRASYDYLREKVNIDEYSGQPGWLPLDFSMSIFDELEDKGMDELPPIPETMRALQRQTMEEHEKRVKEAAAREHAEYVKRFQAGQRMRQAMMAELKRQARESMEKAASNTMEPAVVAPAQRAEVTAPPPPPEPDTPPESADRLSQWYWLPAVALILAIAFGLWRFQPSRQARRR